MASFVESNFRISGIRLEKNLAGEWTTNVTVETVTATGAVVRTTALEMTGKIDAEGKTAITTYIKALRLALHEALEVPGTE